MAAQCRTCTGSVHETVTAGCTPHTCTTPCRECGHPGDAHRDWYRQQRGTGFCRRCHPEQAAHLHDYTPDRATQK
ncbi:hypothetical protein [Streptomyces sp. STCH 565 A]|uniref:hypothetical protein n=1 Tax=Streptomyces sp. STCH 565 A TaxID=2950532 RepID=UPI00207549F4|nr:hypothetical protein [Streptomyces sp. STCH 565 A]MCM8552308.1 hypothetical protein [Streptomyces sp. STCH 565 A]